MKLGCQGNRARQTLRSTRSVLRQVPEDSKDPWPRGFRLTKDTCHIKPENRKENESLARHVVRLNTEWKATRSFYSPSLVEIVNVLLDFVFVADSVRLGDRRNLGMRAPTCSSSGLIALLPSMFAVPSAMPHPWAAGSSRLFSFRDINLLTLFVVD